MATVGVTGLISDQIIPTIPANLHCNNVGITDKVLIPIIQSVAQLNHEYPVAYADGSLVFRKHDECDVLQRARTSSQACSEDRHLIQHGVSDGRLRESQVAATDRRKRNAGHVIFDGQFKAVSHQRPQTLFNRIKTTLHSNSIIRHRHAVLLQYNTIQ